MPISLFLAEYLNYHLSVVVGWLYGFIVRFLTSTYLLLLLSLDFFREHSILFSEDNNWGSV